MEDLEIKRIQRKIDRALECNELREAKDLYVKLAAYLTRYEDNEGGLDAYKEALAISEREGWESDAAVVQRMIAETYCALGEYEEAVKYADLYLNYSKKSKDTIEEQRGYATQGRIYFCWAEFLINEKSKYRNKVNKYLNKSLCAYEESLRICLNKLNNIDVREKEEMKSRLFQNLGLVMGSLGKYKEANSNFTIAIQINKTHNFKENLYWCYFNQSEYFYRAGECSNACTYCDLAVKTASTKEEEYDALKLKAKSLLKMGKLLHAKNVLREIYKKQRGKDKEAMEQLRITIFLCKVEKMIMSTVDTNYLEKKKLYERKGDGYCALKQYAQGVNAYLKMLDFAEKICTSRKELLPCYTSLAQTYRDDGQYCSALFYCQKELELIDEHSPEGSKTYLFLAELYEILNYDYDTVSMAYHKALQIAQDVSDKVQESVVLSNLIQMESDFGYFDQAEDHRKALEKLRTDLGDTFDEDSSGDINPETFVIDVGDDELLSDDEDTKQRHHTRRDCFKVKRNQKGETELHVATIKGDLKKVRLLIEKGHPVNERDLAGWSVLHEASNHGYVDIVKVLLDNGAEIDDPGGEECEGITPLHDAAENGHLNVIRLLLQRGACKAVVTNQGDTPLDCLRRWRARVTLDAREEIEFEEIYNSLKSNLDSAFTKEKRKRLTGVSSSNKDDLKSGTDCSVSEEVKDRSSAAELYRLAIDGVRRRHEVKSGSKILKKSKPALISEEEVVEDWLEEDMEIGEQSSKRRKILSAIPLPEPDYSTAKDHDLEMVFETLELRNESDVGSERSRSPSPVFSVKRKPSNVVRGELLPGENEPEAHPPVADPTTTERETVRAKSPEKEIIWHKFKVPLMNDVFLIPVMESEMKNLTVQWLADKVAERYNKIYGRIPEVLLMTSDNAIAIGKDPLTLLANEEIKTRVQKWKKFKLGDAYTKLLQESPRPEVIFSLLPDLPKPDPEVANALNNFDSTGDLILRDKHLELRNFLPVLEILGNTERDVKIMDLSRNFLGDEVIDPLMDYLERQSFQRLYLLSNGITVRGIKQFASRIATVPEENLMKINCLDFSFNRLRDESKDYLNAIADKLKNLDYLGTDYCGLSRPLEKLTVSRPANPTEDRGNDPISEITPDAVLIDLEEAPHP